MAKTTAKEMARQAGVDPRIFRQALREEKFPWHGYYERWTVESGSDQHAEMQRVLRKLSR
jgi:cyclopropane fatty-acyl-phospholipid synthase-like methyltransferase